MARVRVLKKDGNAYLKLPGEFLELEELEVFALRDGCYLLSVPLDKLKQGYNGLQKDIALNENERLLLKKLFSIKFESRIPNNIDRVLNENEKKFLQSLISKGLINIFKSKKYPDGVYNIKDNIYPLLKVDPDKINATEAKGEAVNKGSETVQKNQQPKPEQLRKDLGYTIISDQKQAYDFSRELKSSGKDKDMICLKGFDGKFYAVSKRYFANNSEKIKEALINENNINNVAKICALDQEGCRAILNVLADRGEVIEKRKDNFALA